MYKINTSGSPFCVCVLVTYTHLNATVLDRTEVLNGLGQMLTFGLASSSFRDYCPFSCRSGKVKQWEIRKGSQLST